VPLNAAVSGKSRAIEYFYDIYSGVILDARGHPVSPWEVKANRWIKVTGVFPPTSTKYDSFGEDPEVAYIESVKVRRGGDLQIKTSKGDLGEVILARAAGGATA